MLKNLKDITPIEYNYLKTHKITIYEKLDLFYFNVLVTTDNTTILKSNHHIIDKIDMIMNSMYSDIVDFVNNNIVPIKDIILDKYGEVIIGFFYCPIDKPILVDYSKSDIVGKFILGNIKSILSNSKVEENFIDYTIFNNSTYTVLNYPIFTSIESIESDAYADELFNSYIKCSNTDTEFISKLTSIDSLCLKNSKSTFSGLPSDKIEGLIIKTDKYTFQVVNPIYDKSTKKYESKIEYYDQFLKDFIN